MMLRGKLFLVVFSQCNHLNFRWKVYLKLMYCHHLKSRIGLTELCLAKQKMAFIVPYMLNLLFYNFVFYIVFEFILNL